MKGITFLQDVCKYVADKSAAEPQNHVAEESAAVPRDFDPMADLEACSALADLSTPENDRNDHAACVMQRRRLVGPPMCAWST